MTIINNKPVLTLEKVTEVLEAVVADAEAIHPGVKYDYMAALAMGEDPNVPNPRYSCRYYVDGGSKRAVERHGTPMCIVGHVVHRLGVEDLPAALNYDQGKNAQQVVNDLLEHHLVERPASEEELYRVKVLLSAAQSKQDDRWSWRDAVQEAKVTAALPLETLHDDFG